jgi:multiple sugar transport system permease protein
MQIDLVKSLRDSLIIAAFTVSFCLVAGTLGGYAFARIAFPRKTEIFTSLMIIQAMPGIAIIIPLFILLRGWGLYDTHIAVSLLQSAFQVPYVVWLLLTFFKEIPEEIESSAFVDGCSRLQAVYRIVLPLARPGLFAVAVYSFLTSWGDFIFALTLTSVSVHPITVLIARNVGVWYTRYGLLAAQTMVSLIIPVVLAVIFQKSLIKGLTAAAVKG